MANVLHKDLVPGAGSGIHVSHAWEVVDATARNALGVVAADVGKIARQTGDNTFWMLAKVTGGVVWTQIGGLVAPVDATYLVVSSNGTLTNESVLTAGSNVTLTPGAGTLTIDAVAAPPSATFVTLTANATLTNERTLAVGTGLTLTDGGANGPVTIAADNLAPNSASYVTISASGSLTSERVLTGSTNITVTDGGANGPVTVAATGLATNTPQFVTLAASGDLTNERVLTAGTGAALVDGGAGNPVTINAGSRSYATQAGLAAVLGAFDGEVAVTQGFSAHNDGQPGVWYWKAGSATAADGGLVIGADPAGRWFRVAPRTLVTAVSGNTTATIHQDVLKVDATGGNVTITLPTAATAYKKLTVKKIDATANTVTIDGDGAETIDDQATAVILSQYTSVTIISDGTEWFIV